MRTGCLFQLKSGRTSAPRLPQALQTNRAQYRTTRRHQQALLLQPTKITRGMPGFAPPPSAKFKRRGGLAQLAVLRVCIHWRPSKARTGLILALGTERRHKPIKQAVASRIGAGVKIGSAAILRVLRRIDQAV